MNSRTIISSLFVIFILISPFVLGQENIIDEFKRENGEEWDVKLGSWGLIIYASRPYPDEAGAFIAEERVISIAKDFLKRNSDLFGIESFTFSSVIFIETEPFHLWVVDFTGKTYGGTLPPEIYLRMHVTRDGQISAVGDIDMFGTENVGDVIPESDAIDVAKEEIGTDQEPAQLNLGVFTEPNETEPRLVWNISFNDSEKKEVLIDATDGSVLSVRSTAEAKGDNFVYLIIGAIVIAIMSIGVLLLKKGKLR